MKQTVIFATTNQGKLDEFKKKINLDPSMFVIIGPRDLDYDIPPCEEIGTTFKENALLKAQHMRSFIVLFIVRITVTLIVSN